MLKKPLEWLRKNWWGLIVAYLLMVGIAYTAVWAAVEPIPLQESFEKIPPFLRSRIFFHLVLTLLIASHTTLILDLILRRKLWPHDEEAKPIRRVLETIGFSPADTNIIDCWQITDTQNSLKPALTTSNDGFCGKVLEIRSSGRYAADYQVQPRANLGRFVEVIAKLSLSDPCFYTLLSVTSKNGSNSKSVWLAFVIGSGNPKPQGDGAGEWQFQVKPSYLEGGWLRFQIDLESAVTQTFGTQGWRFEQLKGFRVRGNLSLAQINVFE